MITKAGVPSNRIVVGVSSYGRSFGAGTPGCFGPTCLFTGPESGAIPGQCTQTAGYLADAEISSLFAQGGVQSRDESSDSDIVVYGNTWVAYMSAATKARRISKYQSQNFAGTVDWAIDLGGSDLGPGNNTDDNPTPANVPLSPSLTCTKLAPGATFTITADCATEISHRGPLTNNNSPPGPANCRENCDLLREFTGTCCGIGGSIGCPVVIVPNVPLPLGLPLPPGFKPTAPVIIPGYTLQPRERSKATIPLPGGFKSPVPIVIPGGSFPPGAVIGRPVILSPGFLPPVPISVGGKVYPPNQPIPEAVPLPPDWVPPPNPKDPLQPFTVPPFVVPAGGPPLPGPVIVPPGWVNPGPGPFPVPPVTYPPGAIVPPGTVIPPGTVFPPGPQSFCPLAPFYPQTFCHPAKGKSHQKKIQRSTLGSYH